jgi:mutator protein MutT
MRRHVGLQLGGPVAEALDGLRSTWDPVMARIAPPHVTVAYPEEIVDVDLLLERLAGAAAETAPIRLSIGGFIGDDDGRGGVFAAVGDPDRGLTALRDRLLLPPQRFSGYPFHTTIAHPRTAGAPADCWAALRGGSLDLSCVVDEAQWTVTGESGRTVLATFPFEGRPSGRVAVAVGILIADGRVLLGLRSRDRANYPGQWDLPGGHVEPGESPRDAVRRELREEIGVEADIAEPWHRIVDDTIGIEMSLWIVRSWRGEPVNLVPHEHERIAWWAPDELPALDLTHPAYVALLSDALEPSGSSGS